MKCFIIFSLILLLGNKFVAQNFTPYPFFNLGNIDNLYTDTIENKLYLNGYIYPTQEIDAHGIVSFQNNEISPLDGCWAYQTSATCRYNGDLYIAGQIYSADSTEIYHFIKWDGMQATPIIVQGQPFNIDIGPVYRIEILNNELYIAGGFRFVDSDGVMANGIAKLVNGEFKSIHNFPKWNVGNNSINLVDCIAMYNDELYVGGRIFDQSPVDTMRHICKWNGTSWQMLGDGISGNLTQVVDMQEYQGKLYISGTFTNPSRNLAVWNGSNWEETVDILSTLVSYGGKIFTMKVYNDELYIGGYFNSVAGIPASNFAKFDGNEWCTFLNDTLGDIVQTMEVYNGELYLSGLLSYVESVNYFDLYPSVNVIAKLNTSGTIYTCIDVVGLSEQGKKDTQIEIYPNPSSDIIHIEWNSNNNLEQTILIYDNLGHILKKIQVNQTSGQNSIAIDISDFEYGIYILDLGTAKHKFIKAQ